MAIPRKFSEKIALLNQKQAEGDAKFAEVMKEVSDATKRVNPLPKQHLRITQPLGSFRGGSLPNVNHVANNSKTELPLILGTLEELKKTARIDGAYRERGRSVGGGPMRSRPVEKRIDTSPYSGAYLSPPPDSAWRRTNSDSALHQTASACGDGTPRRSHDTGQQDPRTRHRYDSALVPGINIYPSQHESGSLQIPVNNNTGSLPDLTCFHFPPPLPTPLDQEENSTSPQGTSPQPVPPGKFPFHSRSNATHTRPLSPAQQRRIYPTQNLANVINSAHSPCEDGIYRHLTVPTLMNSSYLHHTKVVTQDHSLLDEYSFAPLSPSLVTNNCSLSPQPDHPNHPAHQQHHGYRSPQPTRPSPQSSPGLTVPYRCGSPGDSQHSAPPSPVSAASSPASHHFGPNNTNFFLTQAELQQHFEQFNMMDAPSSASITYIASPSSSTNTQVMSPDDTGGQEMGTDPGYFSTSPSQLHYGKPGSTQQTTPQTPNTPSSIPDIILTDFSSGPDELSKHELKELGNTMNSAYDTDLFPSDESLREGLGPIDLDGFQMLTDPGMVISDPAAEDHFRLDRL